MFTLFLQAQGEKPSFLVQFGPLLLIVVVFFVFMIMPQQKRQKELRIFRESLKKGDKVMTTGGIYGKVYEVREQNKIVLEISDNIRITVDKSAVIKDVTDVSK